MTKLLGVCCIEVFALTYINFNVRAGEEYDYSIKVHNLQNKEGSTPQRTIELFSSDSTLIYPPNGKKRNVQLLKDIKKFAQGFPLMIRSRQQGVSRARVNCVDINSREVVESFLFDIQADKPQCDRVVPIKAFTAKEMLFKFNW